MIDAVALGELLIDFTYCGTSASGMRLFEQNPGGAPANMLCALSRLDKGTAFIGKVGKDIHGEFLRDTLVKAGVDVSGLVETAEAFTTLAFVDLSVNGERRFSFSRNPGADTCLGIEDIKTDLLESARIFHFGSLSLTHEPARTATLYALDAAKKANAEISFDPNYRAPLWQSEKQAASQMRSVLEYVDMIKISEEETSLMTDRSDPREAAKYLSDAGVPCVVVTLGDKGSLACIRGDIITVDAIRSDAVDTTGAGDAFWGGFLYRFLETGKRSTELSLDEARDCLMFGNTAAALCIRKRGAIPALPTLEEVLALMGGRGYCPTLLSKMV